MGSTEEAFNRSSGFSTLGKSPANISSISSFLFSSKPLSTACSSKIGLLFLEGLETEVGFGEGLTLVGLGKKDSLTLGKVKVSPCVFDTLLSSALDGRTSGLESLDKSELGFGTVLDLFLLSSML